MGKNGLKLRIKPHHHAFVVQQYRRFGSQAHWETLGTFNTLEECVTAFPYAKVRDSAKWLAKQ